MNIAALVQYLPKTSSAPFCPTEVRDSLPISPDASWLKRFRRYAGLGMLVAVGYMDPGNWATDIEAGSSFAYELLSVVLAASLIAMLLQVLCVRLGMVTGKDIAQHCREEFPKPVNFALWVFAQIAVIACDFAEVLGTALALQLLFGLPLASGVVLTAFDTLLVLALQSSGAIRIEKLVMLLVLVISGIFAVEITMSHPDWNAVMQGFVPSAGLWQDSHRWLVAIGILGATVMPHNLYLHSSVVTTRKLMPKAGVRRDAIRLLSLDTLLTLTLAFFVNAAILIVAASVFHFSGHQEVATISEAHTLLSPLLGASAASALFAVALFAAGQSSTLTGTIAGQVILQGFLNLRIPCWQQRLLTRMTAILPAWLAISWFGEAILGRLLILSQVVLSMQLPFAMIPLILFTRSKRLMGSYRNSYPMSLLYWMLGLGIVAANLYLLRSMIYGMQGA